MQNPAKEIAIVGTIEKLNPLEINNAKTPPAAKEIITRGMLIKNKAKCFISMLRRFGL